MADPTAQGIPTDNYGFMKPTVGGDADVWGSDYTIGDPAVDPSPGLNGNWAKIDVLMKALEDRLAAAEALIENNKVKVGGVLVTGKTYADGDAVAADLGYGTWAKWGEGRALVSAGDGGTGVVLGIGNQTGNSTVTLATSQIPSHRHLHNPTPQTFTTTSSGFHDHVTGAGGSFLVGQQGAGSSGYDSGNQYANITARANTGGAGAHTHQITVDLGQEYTEFTGDGGSHTNVQPSIGVGVWRRTA